MSNAKPKSRFSRRNILIIAGSLLALCVICVAIGVIFSPTEDEPAQVAQAETEVSQRTQSAEGTSLPTETPAPTNTPEPTNTPRPTDTPEPTDTPTPPPEPIVLSGSGDQVINVDKWDGPAIAHFNYSGGSNFIVENFGPDGERIELLINTIGGYQGVRPIDFLENEETTRFQIQSSGDWTIEILPLTEIRRVSIPGTFEGNGDDVVFLEGNNPDLLNVNATQASQNFIVIGYGNRRELLVNEIAPYEGTSIIDSDLVILEIQATGPWSLEITTN